MAPNFLSKFVKTNGSLAPANNHQRVRTTSDIGPHRASTIAGPIDASTTPSLILTNENDSPVQPSTPGSLHRSDSPHGRRARSASLSPSDRSRILRKESRESTLVETERTQSAPSSTGNTEANEVEEGSMGLGIDLGLPANSNVSPLSHAPGLPAEASVSNGIENMIRRKFSSRSLVQKAESTQSILDPSKTSISSDGQEAEIPFRTTVLVDSPKSDHTPTVTSFPTMAEMEAIPSANAALSPSLSVLSSSSLAPHGIKDSDTVSITSSVSVNKKMPWRRGSGGSSKKRKPTAGLAGAIAASGLMMANPVGSQSLVQFMPPVPNSPPRSQPQSPRPSLQGNRSRVVSNGSRVRSRAGSSSVNMVEEQGVNGDQTDASSDSYEDGLDIDEEIPVTGFAVASNKRNADFHEMFPQVPEGDYLIEDYGCALQREILIQGRLYISENHICFHANIFGWITDLIIPVYEIISLEKKMTALFIPNALQITTRNSKYTFASFLSRDTTYDVIHNIWRLVRPDAESLSGEVSGRPSLDDPELLKSGPASTIATSLLSPVPEKITQCKCGKDGTHYPETALVAVFPGTPEKIYNLMFASGFIKDFMTEEQNLKDLQISDWVPDPDTKLLSRKFSYIKILNGVVKQTKCELVDETLYCNFDDYICTLTTTRTPDVPSGGAFSVKTKTCIMWASAATTKVVVTTQVEWTGRSFIKSMINSSAIEGQKQYHADLEKAMRKYITEHKTEFVPEGMEDVVTSPAVINAIGEENAANGVNVPLSEEEASKKREHERNQRATQWAFDTVMGAWKVARQSTLDAVDLVSDAWDQSSSTTILYFVIVVLVISNLWTLVMVGRREEVGRRKEMIKIEEQKKWVHSIVAALWEERQTGRHYPGGTQLPDTIPPSATPSSSGDFNLELAELNRELDIVEERIRNIRQSLNNLD